MGKILNCAIVEVGRRFVVDPQPFGMAGRCTS
jgi:hypothetical protein